MDHSNRFTCSFSMLSYKLMASSLLFAILLVALVDSADGTARGLQSIPGFCDGTEELDDLRDLTVDAYKEVSGRFGNAVVKAQDSAGYPDFLGDYKSTPSDGWVSSNLIMNNIVGMACTAGKNSGKKQCVCPKEITIRGPGNFQQWSITAPETVVGWTFAVLEFLGFLLYQTWPTLAQMVRRMCHSKQKKDDAKMMAGEAAKMRKKNINIY